MDDDYEWSSVIRDYYRYRTCPACRYARMVVAYDTDSVYCPHSACNFVVSGKADRAGGEALLAAVEAHKRHIASGVSDRLLALEQRLTRLEEQAAYDDSE